VKINKSQSVLNDFILRIDRPDFLLLFFFLMLG